MNMLQFSLAKFPTTSAVCARSCRRCLRRPTVAPFQVAPGGAVWPGMGSMGSTSVIASIALRDPLRVRDGAVAFWGAGRRMSPDGGDEVPGEASKTLKNRLAVICFSRRAGSSHAPRHLSPTRSIHQVLKCRGVLTREHILRPVLATRASSHRPNYPFALEA